MGYTPNNQLLEPSLDKIISGCTEFLNNSENRLENHRDWEQSHLKELEKLNKKLLKLKNKLIKLREHVR